MISRVKIQAVVHLSLTFHRQNAMSYLLAET